MLRSHKNMIFESQQLNTWLSDHEPFTVCATVQTFSAFLVLWCSVPSKFNDLFLTILVAVIRIDTIFTAETKRQGIQSSDRA